MDPSTAEALVPKFQIDRILNQDQSGRRLILLGTITSLPSLLILERSALPSTLSSARALHSALTSITNLGANDIYAWYLASHSTLPPSSHDSTTLATPTSEPTSSSTSDAPKDAPPPGLKINLIHPCSEKHIRKYSPQKLKVVAETATVFRQHVRPYMLGEREGGRLDWVYNILEGRTEQEDVIHRETSSAVLKAMTATSMTTTAATAKTTSAGAVLMGRGGEDGEGQAAENLGWLLLPDMNWDRTTPSSLRILCLVERRDLLSMRDLRKRDLPWLRSLLAGVTRAVAARYGIERDELKVYVHYQPTYYHFHVHVVSAQMEPNATQAVGKAFGLGNLISWLEGLEGDEQRSLADVTVTYTLGEGSELWTKVYGPLKQEEKERESEDQQPSQI